MADENQEALVEDAVVVTEDPVVVEEKADAELAAEVAKMLNPEETPDDKSEEPGTKPEATADEGEGEKEEVVEIDEKLQSRATQAGLTDEMAKQLHQSGQLKQVLTAFDRKMVEYVQSQEEPAKEEPAKDEGQRETQPPPKDQKDVPALDPEEYPEDLINRDAYQTKQIAEQAKRIDFLEAQLQSWQAERESGFDNWLDGMIADLGGNVKDTEKCQETWKFYQSLCLVNGVEPYAKHSDLAERAFDAVHPEVTEKKTVDRLRDKEGRFVSSPSSRGAPPPKEEMKTEDQMDAELVAEVTAYGKRKGIRWSGV